MALNAYLSLKGQKQGEIKLQEIKRVDSSDSDEEI